MGTFCSQPRPRNKLEENQRHPFPQQSQNEEFKRRPRNTQFPAGRRGDVRMHGGESARQKCCTGSYFIPWLVSHVKLNASRYPHFYRENIHMSSGFNLICWIYSMLPWSDRTGYGPRLVKSEYYFRGSKFIYSNLFANLYSSFCW